ncbi:MAG: beta-propeller fold lactonase family protein, partial [Solirubrobacteraceae bacterium]
GHVYVNDNTAGVNTIAAYDRHPDGTLTAVPGSPFPTSGAGTGAAIGSQGALQITPDGHYLVAVDAGSNQVSTLAIRPDGGLAQLPGDTVSSGGADPVSIAIHDDLVYVANASPTAPNFTGFRLGWFGRLAAIPGSTVGLPPGSQPGDVLFNATGSTIAGTLVASSQIVSYRVDSSGRLDAAPGSPYTAQGLGPFGSEFSPVNPNQLFVSNAHGGTNAGSVSAFRVGPGSSLSSIGSSPFADNQTAPCWVEISHDGRFLFAVNTAVPSISSYVVGFDGSLALLGSVPFQGASAVGPEDARLSPDGSTLWVVDSGGDALSGFAVHGGTLTSLASAPVALPAGAAPFGVVVN